MKSAKVTPLSSDCHPERGRQEGGICSSRELFLRRVTPCHPFVGEKLHGNKEGVEHKRIYKPIGKLGVTRGDSPTSEGQAAARKDDVRRVLEWLGREPTSDNFKLLDPIMDWATTAKSINCPTRTALCHIIDGCGRVVTDRGKPVVVARDVETSTEAEAAEILSRSSHVFVRWWPSDAPNGPGAGADDKQYETHDNAQSKQGNPKDYGSRVIEATMDFMDSPRSRVKRISKELKLS